MVRQIAYRQKISFLIVAGFLLILISAIGFGSAVVYSMARLQSNTRDVYVHPYAVGNAGLDAHATLSQLRNLMLEIILANDPNNIGQQNAEILALDKNLRTDFSIVKADFPGDPGKIIEIERLLDDWQNMRMRLIGLARHGHRDKALQLAIGGNLQIYSQLDRDMAYVVTSARQHMETLAEAAKTRSAAITHLTWWFLGGLVLSSILSGVVIVRRVGTILEHDMQTAKRSHESEERLKLALSGADEGTWDLDVPTGHLNFDSQWGSILGYTSERERPHYLEEWAALIHAEDRDRVLNAMHEHVEGWASEYKAEYRIRSRSGTIKWIVGHGRAVRRDMGGKALRVVGVTRDITLKKQAEDKIWQLAHSDFLTGLPNRPLFYDHLMQSIAVAKRHNRKFALLFLDLDGFKQINDKFGHDIGDGLLQQVAERLRHNIRGEDTVARTGGDEFTCILNNVSHPENAAIVAGKIIQALTEPFIIHGNTCLIGGSIGISIFPDDSDEMETLVSQADDAMYQAKESGKNTYRFFTNPAAPATCNSNRQ